MRQKSLKVIVGGMPRTGTWTVQAALQELGYKVYGYHVRLELGHLPKWNRMLQRIRAESQADLDMAHVDLLTGNFDCICDAPCFFMVQELARLYPDAKVILNKRELTSWLSSVNKTLRPNYEADLEWRYRLLRWLDFSYARPIMICDELQAMELCDGDYSNTSLQMMRYNQHYNELELILGGHALVYQVQEGWTPLCHFLGQPIPNSEFPRANDVNTLMTSSSQSVEIAIKNSARNTVTAAVLILVTTILLAKAITP